MFLVHKKGFVAGKKMVDGLVPYDFFCEDNPAINLFVFTGSNAQSKPCGGLPALNALRH